VGVTSQANSRNDIFIEDDTDIGENVVTTSIVGPNASDFSVTLQKFPIEIHLENNLFVTFTPSGVGPRTATLVTNYGNIPLSGNGIPDGPSLTITPVSTVVSMLGVATQAAPNGVAPQWTNNGSVVLTSSGAITGPDASSFSVTASGNLTIAPTQSVPFAITFTPSHLGLNTAALTVTDATTGYSNSIPLTGYGEPDAPSVTPSTLNFGPTEIGVQSAAQSATISAPGGDPVSVVYNSAYNPQSNFVVSSGTCATQTPCQISVAFKPSAIGSDSESYIVTDLVTEETSVINLSGSGGVASVSLSSSSLTFAARDLGTTSIPQTVTLTNTGDATLTIAGETFSGANVGDFPIETNTCGSTLASGANCTIGISFDPTASGARSAVLQIMTNAASSPDKIQLMGTGN
jgi:trimeric autotransporter adhesin